MKVFPKKYSEAERPTDENYEKDWLADYPKVLYIYSLSEVAFLVHKLKQFLKKFRKSKYIKKEICPKLRDELLAEIAEKVDLALEIFEMVQRRKQEENSNKGMLFEVFKKQAEVVMLQNKNNLKELKEKRKELIKQFDEVCKEEFNSIKNLLAIFEEESNIRFNWTDNCLTKTSIM